jgi:hypothetical protein
MTTSWVNVIDTISSGKRLQHSARWVQEIGQGNNHICMNMVTMVTQANQNGILGFM